MTHVALLLDKAKKHVSPENYSELARVIGATRQELNAWKSGKAPIPQRRIAQIARIAQEDAGEWWLLIEAERAAPEVRPAVTRKLRALGIAAGIVVAVSVASTSQIMWGMHIMLLAAAIQAVASRSGLSALD